MSDEPWYKSRSVCPQCDEYYHVGMSGNVERNMKEKMDMDGVDSVCVIGPNAEHDFTTLYYHPDALLDSGDS